MAKGRNIQMNVGGCFHEESG